MKDSFGVPSLSRYTFKPQALGFIGAKGIKGLGIGAYGVTLASNHKLTLNPKHLHPKPETPNGLMGVAGATALEGSIGLIGFGFVK